MMFVLSFGTAFATYEVPEDQISNEKTQTEVTTEESVEQPTKPEPAVSRIEKRGKYYYYVDGKTGKIRKKKGFIKFKGNLYYIGKKGRIATDKTLKVNKKYYHVRKNGKIATGVYKWKKKLNYSNPTTGQWYKKERIVKWKGNKYYIKKGGTIATNEVFIFKNLPYKARSNGKLKEIPIPDNGNVVTDVAKQQVGIMTGKTYWKWYFHTRFKDTDATPWCGAFVAWCFNEAGEYNRVTPVKKYGNLGYVPSYTAFANKYGKWVKKSKARGGDIVIYAGSVHVGLVEGIWNGHLITIEGNAGPTALIRGAPGAVVRKICPLDSWKIKGIIRVF